MWSTFAWKIMKYTLRLWVTKNILEKRKLSLQIEAKLTVGTNLNQREKLM